MSASPEHAADRGLVRAFLQRRDEEAFRGLYRRHTPTLFRTALALAGGRAEEAGELVQETWCRAVGAIGGFRWESALSTWLVGCLVRCAREGERVRERTRTSSPEHVIEELDRRVELPRPALEEASDAGLHAAIDRLPAGFREVLVLHDLLGHTHESVGELLGIAPGTSKSQLSRARARLRELLVPAADRAGRGHPEREDRSHG